MTSAIKPYITVTSGMAGYFAVMLWWNDREPGLSGFWEPYETGIGRYKDRAGAEREAQQWAEAEGLVYEP